MDEGVFAASDRDKLGRASSAIQTISSRPRRLALSLTNISNSVLRLKEEINIREKKDTGKERSFSYIQHPSVSLNGLPISLFHEGLVRLCHMVAPIETLQFDGSAYFITSISLIKNKDENPKRILKNTLTIKHHIG